MNKNIKLQQNHAGGIDLLVDRDAGNPILILTGFPKNSLEFWKELKERAEQAIEILEDNPESVSPE